MKRAIITACLFKTMEPIHYLTSSLERYGEGETFWPYGLGRTYTDWPLIKITDMLAHFKMMAMNGDTHILYTDGRDSFFVAPVKEAWKKYEEAGSPGCLMAAETGCYPRVELAELFPDPGHHYRWLGSGQFMGNLEYLIPAWEMLSTYFGVGDQNEQGWMLDAYVTGKFGPEFRLDTGCQIFQSGGNGDTAVGIGEDCELHIKDGRIYNTITNSWPVAIHMNGGYSCPVNGKWSTIEPVWRALDFIPTERIPV